MKVKKLVYGVGINDADYVCQKFQLIGYKDDGKRIFKRIWHCPFYQSWVDMLKRCYSEKFHIKYPSYKDCTTVPEWHYFMTFRNWMEKQSWERKELDKDILLPGNRIYGPNSCVFVDKSVNLFITENRSMRGEYPIGVTFHSLTGKYRAVCQDVLTGKMKHLGLFNIPEKAHQAWLTYKLEQAKILAAQQTDPRVAKALIERYENYVAL